MGKRGFIFSLLYLGASVVGKGYRQISFVRNLLNVITYLGRKK